MGITAARESPGFVRIITPDDIVGEKSQYADQPCLLVLADSTRHAETAAKMISLELEDPERQPCFTVEQCVELQEKSETQTQPKTYWKSSNKYSRGDAAAALESAPRKSSGKAF